MHSSQRSLAKSIIDGFGQVAFLLDTQGTVLELSEAASRFATAPKKELVGRPIWDIAVEPASVETVRLWKHACRCAITGQATPKALQASFGGTPARAFTSTFSVLPLTDASGEVIFLLVRALDIPAVDRKQKQPISLRELSGPIIDNEEIFRLMVESTEDYAMFMVDTEGAIVSWNRGAERLTGYSESEAVGRPFSMLYPREDLDQTHAEHELAVAQRKGRYEEEGIRVRKDGSCYDAQVTMWRIDDDNGVTIGFAKITRDVTAITVARQREAELFESENRFRLMVESIEDYAMFMVDTNGLITSWNRGAGRLTGYTEQEALGQSFSILYAKDQFTEDHATVELAMAMEKGHHEEEGPRVRKDGSIYQAQILVWPMANKSGQVVGFAKITRDVTERRRAEQALRESDTKFRTITDAMPQMVWSTLPNGQWDYANEQWFHFTGMGPSIMTGDEWLGYIHPDNQVRARECWLRSIKTGRIFDQQFRLKHVSGGYRWVLARALPVLNDTNVITRWMGTLTDIHDQKKSEATLQKAARRKDEFLAMLAHELRNPLAPIRNSTLVLRRISTPDDKFGKSLDVIERQVHHMTRLIDDLLDVARISRGKIELCREPIELGELVRNTAEDFRPGFKNKTVNLSVETPTQTLPLAADYTRIAQVVGNLLHNALKFTEPTGQVTLSLICEDQSAKSFAVIKVTDTGIGMEPDLIDQLFVPFIQARQDLARSQGGLGLGLALIRGLVELHGGHVEAYSDGVGRGSEFAVYLPLTTVTATKLDKQNTLTLTAEGLRIVLIDDNQDMVETMVVLLTMEGHEVKSAYDGESGIHLIKSERPDLVLCDIGLPNGKDGYAVARAIRSDPTFAATTLIALSGYGQEEDKQLSRAHGFDGHLLKPVDFNELADLIRATGSSRTASGKPKLM